MNANNTLAHEDRRASIFRWLGLAAIMSFAGLTLLIALATETVIKAEANAILTICCMPAEPVMASVKLWVLRLSAITTALSLISVGWAGLAIFRFTKDQA